MPHVSQCLSMTGYGIVAAHFKTYDKQKLAQLQVLAPYEPAGRIAAWLRGSIRIKPDHSSYSRDFVITGPKMQVCYGGCKWNRLVLALPGAADENVYMFEKWLRAVGETVKAEIWADPSKYKPGAASNTRFVFDDNFIRPSTDPSMYPDELITKLSVRRLASLDNSQDEIVDAEIFTDGPDGPVPVDPQDITNGSYVIPIIKISYFRNNEHFGLTLTVLKAKVFLNEANRRIANRRIENDSWVIDDMDTSN